MNRKEMTIRHCTIGLQKMFEQTPRMQTKEAYEEVINKIRAYWDKYNELKTTLGKHAGTIFLLKLIDEIMSKEVATLPPSQSISCKKGCAHCCRQMVSASQYEAELIVDFCREQGIEISREYLENQAAIEKETWGLSKYRDCVFLKEDQTCGIYPARPAACRKYMVMTPAELCNIQKYPKGEVGVFGVLEVEIIASVFPNLKRDVAEDKPLPVQLLSVLTSEQQSE